MADLSSIQKDAIEIFNRQVVQLRLATYRVAMAEAATRDSSADRRVMEAASTYITESFAKMVRMIRMKTPADYRTTHCVKRIAFGFEKVEAVKDKLKAKGSMWVTLDRKTRHSLGRYDHHQFIVVIGGFEVMVFDLYESNAPTEMYVVVKDIATYKKLKEILG